MNCEVSIERLSPYLDGEAPPDERRAVEEHLAACSGCRRRTESLRALKHAVARLPAREVPPDSVRARIESLRLRSRKKSSAPRVMLRGALALGAMAAMAVVVLLSREPGPTERFADALAADHLESVPAAKPMQVASRDPVEVARFYEGKTPFPPFVPALPGADLLGGRSCKIEGRRVELLFYESSGTILSLFVSDQVLASGCREARGLAVCTRMSGDLSLSLVGDLPIDRAEALLDGVQPP